MKLRSGDLEATFAPEAGMVCCSRRGTAARSCSGSAAGWTPTPETGKTMGIPLLHPWANRLGDWSYEACGREVDLRGLDGVVGVDGATGLPSHGTLPRPWHVVEASAGAVVAEREAARGRVPLLPHTARLEAYARSERAADHDHDRGPRRARPGQLRLSPLPADPRRPARRVARRAAGDAPPGAHRPAAPDGRRPSRSSPTCGPARRPRVRRRLRPADRPRRSSLAGRRPADRGQPSRRASRSPRSTRRRRTT